MRLVWTYKSNPLHIKETEKDKTIIRINYYILSILKAKEFGYKTIIYTDSFSEKYFKDIVDEMHIIEGYDYEILWDDFKIVAMERETDDYALIDGDIILHSKLPLLTEELYVDAFEFGSWKNDYENTVIELTNLGIKNILPEWSNKKLPIMNNGFLHIKNKNFLETYIDRWKKYGQFVSDNKDKLTDKNSASFTSQLLLSLLCEVFNIKPISMSDGFSKKGKYYTHYVGHTKFITPLVPDNYLLGSNNQKSMI